MKMQALKGLAVAAFIVMLGASSAKASTPLLRADIPFDFMAGEYNASGRHLHHNGGHAGRAADPK